ncbi:MAG: transcription termination factor NusA [Clostridiales bacterium]|nr:transcription termination factor NusA [Clostridiales bacterium]
MNTEFFEAVKLLEKEKGIPAEYLYEKIQTALVVALRKDYNGKDIVFCDIKPEKNDMKIYVRKNVVDEIVDEDTDILLDAAKNYSKRAKVGGTIDIPIEPKKFGRIAAQTVKHVVRQGIKDAERTQVMKEFNSRQQELVTAKVQMIDNRTGNATLEIGRAEAILPKGEQVPGEELHVDDLIKVYVVEVIDTEKGPKAMISRTHPGLVKRLFETEVPEIYDGDVEIKAVSREAGSRTKIAVYSKNEDIDPVGSCIGPKGARVGSIVDSLNGEKIDIVRYSENIADFVKEALAPAEVISVEVDSENPPACRVVVPDEQLSLAIGNKGQNARLAAKLTGCKIDIKAESGVEE